MNKRIILAIVSMLALVSQVSAEEKLTIKDFAISAGETKTFSIDLESYLIYAGFQFDMYLPEGITIMEYSANKDRVPESTSLTMEKMDGGAYRFLAAAMNQETLKGLSGGIITITVSAEEGLADGVFTGYFKNVKLSNVVGTGNKYVEIPFPITVLAPSTVTAKSYERFYGDDNPNLGFDVEGGALDGMPEITCEATASSPIGIYDIDIKRGTETNFNVTYVKGTLTINRAPLTITAKSYTIKQGEPIPAFEFTYEGFKNNENEGILTKQPTFSCSAEVGSKPGAYDIIVTGADADNYSFTYVKGILTITDADPVTVTAKSYEITYGDALPEFEYTSTGAALNGTPTISCSATVTSPAGTYPITISKGSVTNYNDTYVNGTLTIKKALLTIKVGEYSKEHGEENPEFTLTYEGFKHDETEEVLTKKPIVSTSATKDSEPGEYALIISGAEAENYEFSYVHGRLTIQAKPAIPGDVNGNNIVDEEDILALIDYISGKVPEKFNQEAADVNGDKVIGVADIICIVNIIMGTE